MRLRMAGEIIQETDKLGRESRWITMRSGLNDLISEDVLDSHILERDAGGYPVCTFSQLLGILIQQKFLIDEV